MATEVTSPSKSKKIATPQLETLKKAFQLMSTARALSDLYEENKAITAKYVHATSKGHEAVQLALGMQLKPQDFVAPYYRDDSILGMFSLFNDG